MSREVAASHFSPDTRDFIRLLHQHEVRYVVVGGEAVIYFGYARLTGDVDFYYDAAPRNAERLYRALLDFWDNDIPGVHGADELMQPDLVLQFGRPPNRIDLLNRLSGVSSFDAVWSTRLTLSLVSDDSATPLYCIGLKQLIANKEATGRPKDFEDLGYLKSVQDSDLD